MMINFQDNHEVLEKVKAIELEGGTRRIERNMTREELDALFKMDDCICSINYETIKDSKKTNNGFGNGFFCKFENKNFPFQKALFTNNHILNKESIDKGKKIKLLYRGKNITIEMTEKRHKFTNESLDYTCIEILEEDGINNFFEIDEAVLNNRSSLKNEDIFILQYNESNSTAFSSGKIFDIMDNIIIHSAVTEKGSSGSALIRRNRNELKYIVGIHYATIKKYDNYNLAISFDNILEDLKLKINEKSSKIIAQIRIPKKNYKARIINSSENAERDGLILESSILKNEKEIRTCSIYINSKKIDFDYYHIFKNPGNYQIIYIFPHLLNSTNLMFYKCKDLEYLDLSNFNTENVTNMSGMFNRCLGLRTLILTNLKTEKVKDMSWMFNECSSLTDLDLSSFNTNKVQNMGKMFNRCDCLVNLNVSTFNTKNVTSMLFMFWGCRSLRKLNLSNFNTEKVENMQGMFSNCQFLEELDVSNFNTEKVTTMLEMFNGCRALEVLDLKSFKITNVKDMLGMFADCNSLVNLDISNFDSKNVIDVNWLFSGCHNLNKENVKSKDNRILKTFD